MPSAMELSSGPRLDRLAWAWNNKDEGCGGNCNTVQRVQDMVRPLTRHLHHPEAAKAPELGAQATSAAAADARSELKVFEVGRAIC